tara:strand:+ start:580 stop:726 length:147 start_codon:yes stop_codon:yes gene_type:complete
MKKDNKDYPKDIDKKSWDLMTNFYDNIIALAYSVGAFVLIYIIFMWLL